MRICKYLLALTLLLFSCDMMAQQEMPFISPTATFINSAGEEEESTSYSGSARLKRIEGAKLVPDIVTINFQTDMLTEVSIDNIPVVGLNMPPGTRLRTFPAKLSVSFVTGMKNYQNMSAADFLIVADYNEISSDSSSQCNVYLRKQPEGIQRVTMKTQQVDYLIEKVATDNQP